MLIVGLYCLLGQAAFADGLEKAIPGCPKWLSIADDFMDECQAHARSFRRNFYPSGGGRAEREENSAWFAPASADSHFLMGCTLNFSHTLSFLGLYYTAEPSAVTQANIAPILGIGFDGDVSLSIDGHPVTFIAVRPFSTTKIKTRWSTVGSPVALNCQPGRAADGIYHLMRGPVSVDLSRFDSEGIISDGIGPDGMQSYEYREFFRSPLPREVIYAQASLALVTTAGSILVRKDYFPQMCNQGFAERIASSPMLLHQLCRITHSIPANSR